MILIYQIFILAVLGWCICNDVCI